MPVMTSWEAKAPLGHKTGYVDHYDPSLLFPIPRHGQRQQLIDHGVLPFQGYDLWRSYEFSWLRPSGQPAIGDLVIEVPAFSPCLIESKSMKLYLNAFHQSVFESKEDVRATIAADLSACAGAAVRVRWEALTGDVAQMPGQLLDELTVNCTDYQVQPHLLTASVRAGTQTMHTHLFKSNCLVTGQPDWGSVCVQVKGIQLDPESLLQYLVSYRQHQAFHEHCVERIYWDIWRLCQPEALSVTACYTRRGGLDISPVRYSNPEGVWHPRRLCRQ